jgi:hypothetical protein
MKTVPPTLEYLRQLEFEGHVLTDAQILGTNVDTFRTTIHTEGGQTFEFQVHGDPETISKHHREIVEHTNYGPEGLANLIYSDACHHAKSEGLPNNRIRICLSEACLQQVGNAIEKRTYYKFHFEVRPALSGISYIFEPITDQ